MEITREQSVVLVLNLVVGLALITIWGVSETLLAAQSMLNDPIDWGYMVILEISQICLTIMLLLVTIVDIYFIATYFYEAWDYRRGSL